MASFRNTHYSCGTLRLLVVFTALLLTPTLAASETVYRCEGPDGIRFSDRPCGPNPETVTIKDTLVGGSVGDNLPDFDSYPENTPPDDDPSETVEEKACRFISSTDIRTYIAREQVVRGMTREQVIKAFGRTSEIYREPRETWVYQTRYYGALYELTYVYFTNGCVDSVEYRKP